MRIDWACAPFAVRLPPPLANTVTVCPKMEPRKVPRPPLLPGYRPNRGLTKRRDLKRTTLPGDSAGLLPASNRKPIIDSAGLAGCSFKTRTARPFHVVPVVWFYYRDHGAPKAQDFHGEYHQRSRGC